MRTSNHLFRKYFIFIEAFKTVLYIYERSMLDLIAARKPIDRLTRFSYLLYIFLGEKPSNNNVTSKPELESINEDMTMFFKMHSYGSLVYF